MTLGYLYLIPVWIAARTNSGWLGFLFSVFSATMLRLSPDTFPNVGSFSNWLVDISAFLIVYAIFERIESSLSSAKSQAHHDALTGLANRRAFHTQARLAIQRAWRKQEDLALVLIDCDKFKEINDQYGHDQGDKALIAIGRALTASFQGRGTVARLGGDEFVILIPNADRQRTRQLVGQFERSLAFLTKEYPYKIGTSIGIAILREDGTSLNEMMERADTRMFRSKNIKHQIATGVVEFSESKQEVS
ncbi:MAG: GGDEF domain-containing protein [Fimbriimonadaceae bacterium]